MSTLSTKQTDHLFWLGRYLERVKTTLEFSVKLYDMVLDQESTFSIPELCERLSIPCIYDDPRSFVTTYLFDKDDPNSVAANLERAFDNAVVMRDVLHSDTLCYIQLAENALTRGAKSVSPMLELQETADYIYAFWGAVEDFVTDVRTRYVMRTGRSVERIDLMLRLRTSDERVKAEGSRLVNRLYKSGMSYEPEAFQRLTETFEGDAWQESVPRLLEDVNSLVRI